MQLKDRQNSDASHMHHQREVTKIFVKGSHNLYECSHSTDNLKPQRINGNVASREAHRFDQNNIK